MNVKVKQDMEHKYTKHFIYQERITLHLDITFTADHFST